MPAEVTRLRPREFYAVVPGASSPDEAEPEPVFYVRTYDGLMSAIEHARLLSAGGGRQDITLTQGRVTRVIRQFSNGRDLTGMLLPLADMPAGRPGAADIRPGAPHGHIPEICTAAKARASGRRPRKNPNMPPAQWPGII